MNNWPSPCDERVQAAAEEMVRWGVEEQAAVRDARAAIAGLEAAGYAVEKKPEVLPEEAYR
jgi:hypothetical protein